VLEPDAHPAAKVFKDALVADGIPYTSFAVTDVAEETDSSGAGVSSPRSRSPWPVTTAVLDDTCGNLIQVASM
jgi:hypothetical protein